MHIESFYDYLKQNVINYNIPHKSIQKRISPWLRPCSKNFPYSMYYVILMKFWVKAVEILLLKIYVKLTLNKKTKGRRLYKSKQIKQISRLKKFMPHLPFQDEKKHKEKKVLPQKTCAKLMFPCWRDHVQIIYM